MTHKEHAKKHAIRLAKRNGLINISLNEVCAAANIAPGSFVYLVGCTFTDFINEIKDECGDTTHKTIVTKGRVNPALRREQLLAVALDLACKVGYQNITRDEIAGRADVSMGLISNYFGTMKKMKRTVMRAAIDQKIHTIIAQGLALNDPHAKKAPEALKKLAVKSLL